MSDTSEKVFLYLFYVFLGLSGSIALPIQFVLEDDLLVQPSQFQVIFSISAVMWCLKFIVGLIIDKYGNSISNYRRIVTVSLLLNSFGWFCISSWSFISSDDLSVELVTLFLFIVFSTLCICDVASDGRMVKYVHKEEEKTVGKMQSVVWGMRSVGRLLGGIAVTILIHRKDSLSGKVSPRQFLDGFVVIPILFVILLWCLVRKPAFTDSYSIPQTDSFKITIKKCVKILRKGRKFIFFMTLLAILPQAGPNMFLFISESVEHHGLGFSTHTLGIVGIVHAASCIAGAYIAYKMIKKINLRYLFVLGLIFGTIIGQTNLILLLGLYDEIGLPAQAFVVTDDVIGAIINEILMLPLLIIMANMIPGNLSTVMYALMTSIDNIFDVFSSLISAEITEQFGIVRDEDTGIIDFTNLWKMSILCSMLGLIPIFFVCWLPRKVEKKELSKDEEHIELTHVMRTESDEESITDV